MPKIDMFTMIEQIRKYNFWDGNHPELGFQRTDYIKKIYASIGNNLVKVLVGQRRAGKSFVLRQLAQQLLDEARELGKKLEAGKVEVKIKVGEGGRAFKLESF